MHLVLWHLFGARQNSARLWQQRTGKVVPDVTYIPVPSRQEMVSTITLTISHSSTGSHIIGSEAKPDLSPTLVYFLIALVLFF